MGVQSNKRQAKKKTPKTRHVAISDDQTALCLSWQWPKCGGITLWVKFVLALSVGACQSDEGNRTYGGGLRRWPLASGPPLGYFPTFLLLALRLLPTLLGSTTRTRHAIGVWLQDRLAAECSPTLPLSTSLAHFCRIHGGHTMLTVASAYYLPT
ncbi:predicted protein [Plenodomus lingam JN3]|uniref:Predicted protein n=1 Tax=Leptosphaeria maculans (strain JN3 / isolate v23.1.3 / race Av1-4-5-6-7-8) TaxID=985895 RepID=E5A485_LEPMJ|nr:predicted protein [Plenodomus lingam JN3]CBX98430.1 predicted protein [Plenodomus lingam JN3]